MILHVEWLYNNQIKTHYTDILLFSNMWKIFYFIYEWNRPKLHISWKKKKVSQLLAPLFLVLGAATPGKNNGTEPISIMSNKVGEHICRDIGPFLCAEPFKILHVDTFALMDCPRQFRPYVFYRVQVQGGHCKTMIMFSQNRFGVDFEVR